MINLIFSQGETQRGDQVRQCPRQEQETEPRSSRSLKGSWWPSQEAPSSAEQGGLPGALPQLPIPVLHASASAGALSEGPSGRWGSRDQCHSGLRARPSTAWRIPVSPTDRPAITAPGARPGSAQTVFAAPAAKVLLGASDRHLHAGRPGRGRGLRGDQGSPRTDAR